MEIGVHIVNLDQLVADWRALDMSAFLPRFADAVGEVTVRNAVSRSPVDTGYLRASLTYESESDGQNAVVVIGSNVKYAIYMEFGTGALTDWPGGGKGYHFPPPAALERWARRHGFGENGGFVVARAIARRGGLAPRRYLRTAIEESLQDYERIARSLATALAQELTTDS